MSLFDRWDDDLTFRRRDVAMSVHERTDTVKGLGRDAAAVAQPAGELAVVNRTAAERGFRQSGAPAIIRDFLQSSCAFIGAPWRETVDAVVSSTRPL